MASKHSPNNTILYKTQTKTEGTRLKEELSDAIIAQNWDKVIQLHVDNPMAFKTKVTTSEGDTALSHLISEEKEVVVEKLVGILKDYDEHESLRILQKKSNNKLRTPLHAAAATGSRRLCEIIIEGTEKEKTNKLVCDRDYSGQTPIFRAVRYGRMEAFLYLHELVFDHEDEREYCWDKDGQTILHIAITREYFDLAYEIIHLYPELVNMVDKDGTSPLHALARKPSAFKSCSTLRGRSNIIYNCLSVEELKDVKSKIDSDKEQEDNKETINLNSPQKKSNNYLNFTGLLISKNAIQLDHSNNESMQVDIESNKGQTRTSSKANNVNKMTTISELACCRIIPFFLGYGQASVRKIKAMKKKHVRSVQVLDALLKYAGKESLRATGLQRKTSSSVISEEDIELDESSDDNLHFGTMFDTATKERHRVKHETPLLLAARYGIVEIIEKLINGRFPTMIYDKDEENRNIVLVALQNRHVEVYKFLLSKYKRDHIVFQKVDDKGNNALHYAAMYDRDCIKPWPVPGTALQMQWEIKWHEYIESTMPSRMCSRTNKEGQTPKELFSQTHKTLVLDGGTWLMSTATSCSVVATLIATVAFASSTTAPGGSDKETGTRVPQETLVNITNPSFELIAILSLVALCFSVTSLLMFLAILTSRHQEKDFGASLPKKILLGLSSLFIAIASMLVTFCAGHFLVFEDKIKYAVLPIYAVTLLPLCFFAAAQFPLYFDLLLATFSTPF